MTMENIRLKCLTLSAVTVEQSQVMGVIEKKIIKLNHA